MKKLFGTDGIRGTANAYPMTPEIAMKVGKAVALIVKEDKDRERHKVVIGKDTRLSGYLLEYAITSGIVSLGVDVYIVGSMPTPAIAHLVRSFNADAGIILSASHNPAKDNGIKIFSGDGFKLPDHAEERIESLVLDGDIAHEHITGKHIGKVFRIEEAKGRYIEFAKNTIGSRSLKNYRIVVDCANGSSYYVASRIFSELGAKVIVLNDRPDGMNINESCGAMHPSGVQSRVKGEKADIGIALDGDADRVIICDETGSIVDGDHILAIAALSLKSKGKLKNNTVVSTVMANRGFELAMENAGINVIRANVGDRYVLDRMHSGDYILGGEQSGHIIFLKHGTTGDGIISALQILSIMAESGKRLSELARCMESFPQVLVNAAVKEKRPLAGMAAVQAKITDAEKMLGDEGRVLVRYSGTENIARVMVEGRDKKEIKNIAQGIADAIIKEAGA